MNTRIVILGNGISAQLFMSYLRYHVSADYSCLVLEKENDIREDTDDVPFYFNKVIEDFSDLFAPVIIEMGIYNNGNVIYEGNIDLAEKYAIKVLGHRSGNTIRFLEKRKKAFVIMDHNGNPGRKMAFYYELRKKNSDQAYLFNTEAVRVDGLRKKVYTSNGDEIEYDFLISTIPLKSLNRITKQCQKEDSLFTACPFIINRFQVEADGRYQVLYCTDAGVRFSRIAKLNDRIFLESRENVDFDLLTQEERRFVNLIFHPVSGPEKSYINYPGRFRQLEDDIWEQIQAMYREQDIFLLGRMATWRFKLVEDIYEDCKEICQWIF